MRIDKFMKVDGLLDAIIENWDKILQIIDEELPTVEEFEAILLGLVDNYRDRIDGIAISAPGWIESDTGYFHHGGALLLGEALPVDQTNGFVFVYA